MQTKTSNKTVVSIRLLALAIGLMSQSVMAQVSDGEVSESHSKASQTKRAYAWLNSQVDQRFTLQLATINGFENCLSVESSEDGIYCFESSTVSDRWFTVTGRYDSIASAEQASLDQGLSGTVVNYIPRLLATRCEMPELNSVYRTHCGNTEQRVQVAVERSEYLDRDAVTPVAAKTLAVESATAVLVSNQTQAQQTVSPKVARPGIQPAQSVNDCSQAPKATSRPRRRPAYPVLVFEADYCNPDRLAPPKALLLPDLAPVPDRWRIVESLGYPENKWDPYNNNNPLKGDRPVFGKDWFYNLSAISDTVVEPRRFPIPVGNASTARAGQLDLIAKGDQYLINENLIVEHVIYRGDTIFRPPDHEFRLITVFNINHTVFDEVGALKADPAEGDTRTEGFIGLQGAFYDYHIRNVSDRYDFDSFRIGIQPFSSDFRGFLFQDNQLGVRFFGTRNNNIYQYNLAWFRRLEKESNSGLNDITDDLREDDIFMANFYWQDFPRKGFISQASITHNRNREADDFFFDDNQFIARPSSLGFERGRDYDVTYLGLSGDGHFGRNNLTFSAYYALGDASNGVFTNQETDISAYFFAAEASRDYDWIRGRVSFLHSSGDDDAFDTDEGGFDAIFENPQFAGGDTAFFIRQNVPLIGGGRVALNGRNSIIPSLRSSKEHGQSNFTNPGVTLIGIGADFDLTPQTRLSFNLNQMWFDETTTLEVARNQSRVRKNIGQDVSAALIWRPLATQNIVLRLSAAVLNPGSGFEDLYGDGTPYSVLGNLILAY
ncbi:MAG: hypothetical protein ACJAQ6_000213 [Arenicella sp.]|jgi:hypothetical protein